jgi:dTDP-4-dehydrorhamnose reductase
MKILLLGANGQVGRELRRSLSRQGALVSATRDGELIDGAVGEVADFDRPESLRALIDRVQPQVVVNAAAYTAVDRAEDEQEAAFRVNAEAPRVIAEACAQHDALLVHYSTDYVFDGTATRPYREDDPTSPLGVYGASKLAGEQTIQTSGARHLIFRTAWVYAAHGQNFLRTMLRLAADRDELRVVADQVGTPTPAGLIADVTATAVGSSIPRSGLWHLTAAGSCSWYDFATAIFSRAQASGLVSRAPGLLPIATSEYPTPARRPAYSCLDTAALRRDFPVELPEWDVCLTGVLAELDR